MSTTISSALAGKTYLITGASSGIGAATALALGRAGANVVLAARRVQACDMIARDIEGLGGKAMAVAMDVDLEADVQAAVASTLERFGRLDGAFNNAGTLGLSRAFHEIEARDLEGVLRTNVMGVFHAMKHQIAAMLQSGGGAIVNNASIVAQVGFPQLAPYNASKHAVMGLTQTAALEYFKQGIRINAVCPGPIDTPMAHIGFGNSANLHAAMSGTPAGRAGYPDEVARAVCFLLSSDASYISGQGLTVDGGFTVQ